MSCDPNFANVVLLLHCNGTDGSTTIIDDSPVGNIMTAAGAAALETGTVKFGSASAQFPGSNTDYISTPLTSGAPLDVLSQSSGDFTLELWFNIPSLSTLTFPLISFGTAGSLEVFRVDLTPSLAGATNLKLSTNISSWQGAGGNLAAPLSINTWYHFAATRAGGVGHFWLSGADITAGNAPGSADWSAAYTAAAGSFVAFGFEAGYMGPNAICFLDDVRFTKGLARYTSTFTPPTSEFGGSCVAAVDLFTKFVGSPVFEAIEFGKLSGGKIWPTYVDTNLRIKK